MYFVNEQQAAGAQLILFTSQRPCDPRQSQTVKSREITSRCSVGLTMTSRDISLGALPHFPAVPSVGRGFRSHGRNRRKEALVTKQQHFWEDIPHYMAT